MDFGGWKGIALFVLVLLVPLAAAQNESILIPLDELTNGSVNASNVSQPAGPVSRPISRAELNALGQNCVNTYECREFVPGEHYFGCYYDNATQGCRCFTGELSLCVNKNLRCAFEHECKPSNVSEGYNYNCEFDTAEGQCRCFTGDFSLCRQEVANRRAIAAPLPPPPAAASPPPPAVPPMNFTQTPPPAVPPPLPPASASLGLGIAAAAGVLVLIGLIIAFTLSRPTYDNLMRKARGAHHRAEMLHEKGHEDDAKEEFAKAEALRKRALKLKKR